MNRINTLLDIEHPILQAPMSWVTSAELVAAVSNAGGMGSLGPNAGQRTEAISPSDNALRLRQVIIKTRRLTAKTFGVNYFTGPEDAAINSYNEEILKVVIEEQVKVLVVVGVPNAREIERLKGLGFIVIFRELHPTVSGARIAAQAGADILVATGFDEGGSTPEIPIGTMTIVPMLADAVDIPVLAAGGITDRRGVDAAFALGAEGVYLGTRFIASTESPAHPQAKQDIIGHGTEDLLLVRTGRGGYWRATPHALTRNAKGLNDQEINQSFARIGSLKAAMLDGKLDEGINTVSGGIQFIREIKSCQEIVDELMSGRDYC